ncbi:DUF6192 family protein [Nonomuraea insulae]|uniref:DUF6192 family protein n=1 Tax=Nonomuraea insulae TaxID=1616787 RepID=A0ABW1CR14_9ACTN
MDGGQLGPGVLGVSTKPLGQGCLGRLGERGRCDQEHAWSWWSASRRCPTRRARGRAASITDEQERYARLAEPPLHERSGTRRWTMDAAKRLVGHQVERPVSVQEKVERIRDPYLGPLTT